MARLPWVLGVISDEGTTFASIYLSRTTPALRVALGCVTHISAWGSGLEKGGIPHLGTFFTHPTRVKFYADILISKYRKIWPGLCLQAVVGV